MNKSLLVASSFALMLNGCGGRNVLYSNFERGPRPDTRVIAIFYDRHGNLYPSDNVSVAPESLRRNDLQLARYFSGERASGARNWDALVQDAGVTVDRSVSFDSAWRVVQTGLRNRVVAEIHRHSESGGSFRPLMVFVHGFNNTAPEAHDWYVVARDSIRRRVPDAVFLEVYWDGLSKLPPLIWSNAQYNFPLVGLELRRVLNSLDPRIPVRILTHSSGGPLIASTLGNASAPLVADDSVYRRYRTLVAEITGDYRPPQPFSFRVGMIVPAASTNTFQLFNESYRGPERLILGLNPDDFATTKLVFSCAFLGSSCLASRLEAFCNEVTPRFAGTQTRLYAFDFSESRHNRRAGFWDDHDMVAYLARDDISRFLDLLVGGDEVTEQGEAAQFCSRYSAPE